MVSIQVGDRVVLSDAPAVDKRGRPPQQGTVRKAWLDVFPEPDMLPEGEPAKMMYYRVDWFNYSDEEMVDDEYPVHVDDMPAYAEGRIVKVAE